MVAAITALTENRAPLWCEYKQQKAGTAWGVLELNGKEWEKGNTSSVSILQRNTLL